MTRQYSRRPTAAIMVAAALLASQVLSAPAAEPAVLQKVPADAYGVVVINNIRTFSNKVSNAANRMNLNLPPDLVGYFTRNLGIARGFDANSSAALVLLKPSAERLAAGYFNGQPPAVLLLPTLDSKTMMAPFAPGEPDKDGICEVKLPQDPSQHGFVATVDDKWVAMATSKEDLQAYLARGDSFAAKTSPEVLKVFDANDMVIWGNVAKLSAPVDKMLDDAQTNIGGQMDLANVTNNLDPFTAAMQRAYIDGVFGFVKEFLKDADSSMLTVRFTDSGATLGLVGNFKADTPMGKFVISQKNAKPVTLAGVPSGDGAFLAAGAISMDSESLASVINNMGNMLLTNQAIAKDPRGADLKKMIDLEKQMAAITTGGTFILLDPPEGGKNGYFNGVALVDTSDPDKYLDLEKQLLQADLMQGMMNPDIKETTAMVPDAITVKDVKLSRISVKVTLREETPDKPIAAENRYAFGLLQKIYGGDGLTAYMGVVGKRVIVIMGSNPPTIDAAIDTAKGNTDTLSGNAMIAATKDQVVANPVAVAYLPVTRWITLIQAAMAPAGRPGAGGPVSPVIANAPPIVMSAGVTGSMMTAEIHVPIATISGIQEAYQRLMRAMQGGGGGAPGGGGTPNGGGLP